MSNLTQTEFGSGAGSQSAQVQSQAKALTQHIISLKSNACVVGQSDELTEADDIMNYLKGINPYEYQGASVAYMNLAQTLQNIADEVAKNAKVLATDWQGQAAQAAMNKFQQVHDNAASLSAQANQASNALGWLGNDVLPKYQQLPPPKVAKGVTHYLADVTGHGNGNAAANKVAQAYLQSLSQHVVTANDYLPNSASTPGGTNALTGTPGPGATGSPASGGPSVPGGNTGAGSFGPFGGTGVGGSNSAVAGNSAGTQGTGSAAGRSGAGGSPGANSGPSPVASLQGYSPSTSSGTTSVANPFASGTGGAASGSGGYTGMPVMAGGFGGSGDMTGKGAGTGRESFDDDLPPDEEASGPGEDVTGSAREPGGAVGDEETGTAAEGTAAGAEAGEAEGGMGMMGGAPGGGGQQDKDRRRQAWMNEDESIWGARDDLGSGMIE